MSMALESLEKLNNLIVPLETKFWFTNIRDKCQCIFKVDIEYTVLQYVAVQ